MTAGTGGKATVGAGKIPRRGSAAADRGTNGDDVAAPKFRKITINVTAEFFEDLRAYATTRGMTITELIRQGLAYERFLYENRHSALILVDDDGENHREREVLLPMSLHRPRIATSGPTVASQTGSGRSRR